MDVFQQPRFLANHMTLNNSIMIGLACGVLSYITLYIGKGLQKYAIEGFKTKKSIKNKHSGIWIFGTILTVLFTLIHWIALNFAPINLIAPLEGTGLVTLLFFSYYALKESMTGKEITGVVFIIIGTVLAALYNTNAGEVDTSRFSMTMFLIISVPLVLMEIILIIISRFSGYKFAGLVIGFSGGTMMALQTLTKRLSFMDDYALIFIPLALLFATATLVFTQLAFAKAKATQVVPCFTSASIIIASLSGKMVLNERLVTIQILGIVTIVIGVILLTAFQKEQANSRLNGNLFRLKRF